MNNLMEMDIVNLVVELAGSLLILLVITAIFSIFGYMIFQWWKHRNRENYALDFATLLVRLPRDNEIKIDAAEQMFAGLYSLKKGGFFSWLKPEDVFAFEIIALKEDLAFYISCSKKIRDLVEKQVHGAYPNADIKEVDDVNIFSEKGRVEFCSLRLDKANHFPIKTYKDLPTDGLSLITSALSKMGAGEGAILQILLQPEGSRWKKKGKKYISGEKTRVRSGKGHLQPRSQGNGARGQQVGQTRV